MEDYIEMIYRHSFNEKEIKVSQLSSYLNINMSSVSKMINKLKSLDLVEYEKYKAIKLTKKGEELGKYLLERHNILNEFFILINKGKSSLEQVEQIEHFFDQETVTNIKNFLKEFYKSE